MLFKIQIEFEIKKEEKLKWMNKRICDKITNIFDKESIDKLLYFSIDFIELNGE